MKYCGNIACTLPPPPQLIQILLRKFCVTDNPKKFSLYEEYGGDCKCFILYGDSPKTPTMNFDPSHFSHFLSMLLWTSPHIVVLYLHTPVPQVMCYYKAAFLLSLQHHPPSSPPIHTRFPSTHTCRLHHPHTHTQTHTPPPP